MSTGSTLLRRCFGLALLAVTACGMDADPRQFGADCRIDRIADVPIATSRGYLLAEATADGRAVRLAVDTGASTTLLTPRAIARLALAADPAPAVNTLGAGGAVPLRRMTLRSLAIGGLALAAPIVAIGESGLLGETGAATDGVLGEDVLSRGDLELDLPKSRLTLHAVVGCPGFAPWRPGGSVVPVRFGRTGLVYLRATVDGRPVRAVLDTGARVSLITSRAAAALGVTATMLAADPALVGSALGGAAMSARTHRFARVALGPLPAAEMRLAVADVTLAGIDVLIGLDWLAGRHVWLSREAGALFIHP